MVLRHMARQEKIQTNISSLQSMLKEKQQQWSVLRELLEAAQLRMKSYADNERPEK